LKAISSHEVVKRATKSRLAIWSLIIVIVLIILACIFAFFVFSTSNPTNQSSLNTIISTEENISTTIAPTTYQTQNSEPIEITSVFWGMLVLFFSLIFSALRRMANRR
jgi:flagellar basal body-associated protein FliL